MINLLTGLKGSGKTKHLIALAHEAVKVSKGHVVCVEKGDTLTYDVDHKARLVNIEDYGIRGYDALYGFICGMCACNYDITDILIDSTLKIGDPQSYTPGNKKDIAGLVGFLNRIAPLSEQTGVVFTFSISADGSELPEELDKIAKRI